MKQYINGTHPCRQGAPFVGTLRELSVAMEKDVGGRWSVANLHRWGAKKQMDQVAAKSARPHRSLQHKGEREAVADHDEDGGAEPWDILEVPGEK